MRWLTTLALPVLLLLAAAVAVACGGSASPAPLDEVRLTPPPSRSFVDGIVVTVGGDSLTLHPIYDAGPTVDIELTEETMIWKGEYVTLAEIEVGDRAFATVKTSPDGREAVQLYLNIARADGRIVYVNDSAFVIEGNPTISPHTDVAVIRVGRATELIGGSESDLYVDRNVSVTGVKERDGSILADKIWFGDGATPSP